MLSMRESRGGAPAESPPADRAFWMSIGAFAVYNVLIGYLLARRETGTLTDLAFFSLAMGVLFVVNDYGLREDHGDAYSRVGRWLLAGSVIVGWMGGIEWRLPQSAVASVTAAIAGGVILNVFKEELPAERRAGSCRFSSALPDTRRSC